MLKVGDRKVKPNTLSTTQRVNGHTCNYMDFC